jgi:hypothetical protein
VHSEGGPWLAIKETAASYDPASQPGCHAGSRSEIATKFLYDFVFDGGARKGEKKLVHET